MRWDGGSKEAGRAQDDVGKAAAFFCASHTSQVISALPKDPGWVSG